jgi:catecholate siderophore receptor
MEDEMPSGMLRAATIAVVAICFSDGAFAVDGGRPHHRPAPAHGATSASRSEDGLKTALRASTTLRAANRKQKAARTLAADRDPYADPAAPYKADRLSSPRESQPILNIPGQTTVLTRQILDDKNATTLRDALGTTAGVTVGR